MFSYYHHWWIVPVIATHAGAVAGAWIYYLAIEVIIIMIIIMTLMILMIMIVTLVL